MISCSITKLLNRRSYETEVSEKSVFGFVLLFLRVCI